MISRKYSLLLLLSLVLANPSVGAPTLADGLPQTSPASAGMDERRLAKIENLVQGAIAEGNMPGCVVCIGRRGHLVFLEAFGQRKVGPDAEAMTTDTLFDLASITKPVATATSIMKLMEDGHLRLDDKVVTFLPEFGAHGKDEITIRQLLIHQSGLIPDNKLSDYDDGPQLAWERICELELVAPVGTTFKYSDVNFIVLAKLIEKLSGRNVDEFSRQEIFEPLNMRETGYLPPDELKRRAAPTERRNGDWMRGVVHDPRAYRLNGVAGHAGLFSTARDLSIYAHTMLSGGTCRLPGNDNPAAVRILSSRTVDKMTAAYAVSSGWRGLGWDKETGFSSNRGDLLSDSAFGHGGFTGTVLWMDPELELFFIFLSNRLHPDGEGSVNHLAGRILNVVASSITDCGAEVPDAASAIQAISPTALPCSDKISGSASTQPVEQPKSRVVEVLTGIDVLQHSNYRALRDQRIGLITNHTGCNREGVSTSKLLHAAKSVDLRVLFSPEHGFAGKLDISEVGDTVDPTSGLTVFSLYGETRKPTAEMLAKVDTLVFDIQDIGTRFYTYISTMGEAMRAAAEAGKRFVVLDRPNPIGGREVTGPMLDPGSESFVGYHCLPVRHGMTVGEIARLLNSELQLELDLLVVECQGWTRNMTWDATGLTWINPSPNMRSLTQAFLYPGIGLLETTNLSVGRGTDTPFEVLGAPWIDGQELARRLHARGLPGVSFVPIKFQPEASKYVGETCGGINIIIIDRAAFEPVQVGLDIATQLRSLYPQAWDTRSLNRLLCNQTTYQNIVSGQPADVVCERRQRDVTEFLKRRAKFLLYD